jgi:hypothetical protein
VPVFKTPDLPMLFFSPDEVHILWCSGAIIWLKIAYLQEELFKKRQKKSLLADINRV